MVEKLLTFFREVFDTYGLIGLLLLIFVLDKVKAFDKAKRFVEKQDGKHNKRVDEEFVNHKHRRIDESELRLLHEIEEKVKDMDNYGMRLAGVENSINFEKERIDKHIELESTEAERFVKLEGRMDAIENDRDHLYSQSKTLFDKFDRLDAKIDVKFDTITKILLERK